MTRGPRGAARGSLVAAAAVLLATPAAADPGRIGLSADGRTWAPTLPAPLFDPNLRWVPGDRRVATFWVRNESGDPADLTIEIVGVGDDSLLRTGDLTVAARPDGGTWREVSHVGTRRLASEVAAPPGRARRVDVAVTLDADSTNRSMTRSVALRMRVVLQQSVPATAPDEARTGDPAPRPGVLPTVGGPALWLLLGAVASIATGACLRARHGVAERAP